jgi:pimeloyl-ACP methyl ester carboxylesterase
MIIRAYHREISAARARLRRSGAALAQTALGPIEYVSFGSGPPVLLVHGVVGGADQARGTADAYLGAGFSVVGVTRFGYVSSPIGEDGSPEAQADRYAALLDTLGIHRAAVLGTSAGTASCLQFALRHPERCTALVLFSMAVPPYAVPPPWARALVRGFCRTDFLFWLAFKVTRLRNRLVGVRDSSVSEAGPADRALLRGLTQSLLPGSARADGIVHDMAVTNPDLNEGYDLTQIRVPALVFHARDDRWGAFSSAREIASAIPGVQVRTIEDGGHLLLGHRHEVTSEISAFVRRHASAQAPDSRLGRSDQQPPVVPRDASDA